MLGNRKFRSIAAAVVQRRQYVALFNMARLYLDFPGNLYRYLSGRGQYPYAVKLRTPLGVVAPVLDSFHDLLTVNEVFCRGDYVVDGPLRTVLDIGSNIGVSALYFLTRNHESRCYLYEPDERNIARLKANLAAFASRYRLVEAAVGDTTGRLQFGIEPTGRYGGLGRSTGHTIMVDCIHINEALSRIFAEVDTVDLIKIDTEGMEVRTVEAIDPRFLPRIRNIYLEARPNRALHRDYFSQRQYGGICRLTNKLH